MRPGGETHSNRKASAASRHANTTNPKAWSSATSRVRSFSSLSTKTNVPCVFKRHPFDFLFKEQVMFLKKNKSISMHDRMPKVAKKTKAPTRTRYRNEEFLETLGNHCRRLRTSRGYSIDRMSKESEQLSPSVIHRLEQGSGAVTVAALFRYAEVLGLSPKTLLDFPLESATEKAFEPEIIDNSDPRVERGAYRTLLPLLSLQAAAGGFGKGGDVDTLGWIEVPMARPLGKEFFIAQAQGDSMLPKIRSGDYLVFRANSQGTRQDKIVLAEYRGPADPETGGSYTVKKYRSAKVLDTNGHWKHREVSLLPLNPEFEPIILSPADETEFRIVGECLGVLGRTF